MFLHRFEQRALRFRRGAVDLVGENDIRETGPLHENKGAATGLIGLLQNIGAGDIRRHQVGRELNAVESSDMTCASELTIVVFARPGTPISSACPRARMQMSNRSITSSWPMITLPNSARILS